MKNFEVDSRFLGVSEDEIEEAIAVFNEKYNTVLEDLRIKEPSITEDFLKRCALNYCVILIMQKAKDNLIKDIKEHENN